MAEAADFIGSSSCASCHQKEYREWQGSHHERSMDHASPESVKGDFNNKSLEFKGKVNRFFQKDGRYWVTIAGADGTFRNYEIKFTFGYEPLQQYMVEFEDGRIQLIPFAWDTRSKAEGGQRWFYLHPEHSEAHHEFFWTNPGQNWNYMCADCHSTNVKKNYDLKTNRYNTRYSEINVACEACHGPASDHIQWASKQTKTNSGTRFGFDRVISKAVHQWQMAEGATTASPQETAHSDQTLVCAQCHSRHVQISQNEYVSSGKLGNRYMLNLIDRDHYYPDGQVYDEDYVYGSFLQSKMNTNGVVCSNCHNPHTAKLTAPKETLCLQCHQPSTYASKKHHHHAVDSPGAQCVNCHMPETTYMQVDARRDHKWHIPRADYAHKLGTPDACLHCHTDKDSLWSDKTTEAWKPGRKAVDESQFAPVFFAADQGYQEAASSLSHIAQNEGHTAIIRASALERLGRYADTNTLIATARGAKHQNEFIRLGAIRGAEHLPLKERWRILSPLLKDSVLAIRTETVAILMPLWRELSSSQREQLQPVLEEYFQVQVFNSDRGFSHTNMGNMFVHQAKLAEAQKAYRQSIDIEPGFDAAHLYLAETYRQQGNEASAIASLKTGAKENPDSGEFPYRLGLANIRSKDYSSAVSHFRKAIALDKQNSQYHYVLALTLEASTPASALKSMRLAYETSGNPQHLYAACEIALRNKLPDAAACLKELSRLVSAEIVQELKSQYE